MNVVFTICSNNYLPQAKILGDSLKECDSDYKFFIGLVDVYCSDIDYDKEIGYPLILVQDIGIPSLETLWKKYNIIELNTCVKPFFIQYFVKNFNNLEYLFYLDPDIVVYDNLGLVESEFEDSYQILLTPHILSPIQLDKKTPSENVFLNHGTFNLGFIGIRNPGLKLDFINWWKERTYNLGYDQTENGFFVDQLWINLVPIFFNDVKISKNPGLNMAPWNLHERRLQYKNDKIYVNDIYPLIFYHFSSFNHNNPSNISSKFNRYNFKTNPDLLHLYKDYTSLLLHNGVQKFELIKCYYIILKERYANMEAQKRVKSSFKSLVKYSIKKRLPRKLLNIINAVRQ